MRCFGPWYHRNARALLVAVICGLMAIMLYFAAVGSVGDQPIGAWLRQQQALQAANTNIYRDATLRIILAKSPDWVFATDEQRAQTVSRTKVKDEEFQKIVHRYGTAPAVMIMKYPEPYSDVNPTVKMNVRPMTALSTNNPLAKLNIIAEGVERAFEDFEMVVAPKEARLAAKRAAYMKVHFSMSIPDGRKFFICTETWAVPKGTNFILLFASTRQDEKTGKREETQRIVSSLKFY
jgi:hypothetical protein